MHEHQQIQQSKKPDTTFRKQATSASQTHVSNPFLIMQCARTVQNYLPRITFCSSSAASETVTSGIKHANLEVY
jgi:hypothetical protein